MVLFGYVIVIASQLYAVVSHENVKKPLENRQSKVFFAQKMVKIDTSSS